MDNFVIVIDSREQTPFFKKPPKGIMIVRDKLDTGDYSIKGFEDMISIERKNPDDFISSVISDRKRFMSEILRLQEYEYAEIVVECTISKLISKCGGNEPGPKVKTKFRPRTNKGLRQVHPNALIQAIYSIRGKYNIPIHFAENRKAAEEWVLGTLKKYYKGKRG